MPVTFGAPFQTQPVGRITARSGMQNPLNRNRYYILKYAGANGLFIQVREPITGWGAEERIFDRVAYIYSSPQLCFNSVGDMMVVFHGQDPGLTNQYVYAYFQSADGSVVYTTALSLAMGTPGMTQMTVLGLTCKGPLNFLAVWQESTIDGRGHLWQAEFDGLTRTWGAKAALGDPVGIVSYDGVIVHQHPKDGTLHYAALARVSGFGNDLWYFNAAQGLWKAVWEVPDANHTFWDIDMELDPRYEQRVHLVGNLRRVSGDLTDSVINYFQRDINGAWDVSPTTISDHPLSGAGQPSIECDSNGDLYFLWREWNFSSLKMAVWFKRRIDSNFTWESTILVADSILANVRDTFSDDPDYPGIIRTPCTDPKIGDFCVTWGDDPMAGGGDETYVYVSCSHIRDLVDSQSLAILYTLNAVYKDDLLIAQSAGDSWSKWKGPGSRPLNCIRFLTLDTAVDNGILIYATADSTGAWVNQLKTGNIDVDASYEFRWSSSDRSQSGPKVYRFVNLRAEGVTDPVTFTWETDGGRATGSFVVYRDGWHQIPLPANCQGREFTLTLSMTGTGDSPKFHDMAIQGYPKRQLYPRRPTNA